MTGKSIGWAISVGCALWLMIASASFAGGMSGGNCGCHKPPPSPPPQHHNNNNHTNINVNVNVQATAKSNASSRSNASSSANANATANANASAVAAVAARGGGFGASQAFVGGGGGGGGVFSAPSGVVQTLSVEGGERSAYEATRTRFEKVVIQAFCFDDKQVPHPASQVSPEREIDEAYDGELYRCIAGTHMQVTIAQWNEHISFEGGQTLTCQKGEALYHAPGHGGGRLECRAQKPARDCNERSLLRRFGAGQKILMVEITEKYTAYRETHDVAAGNISLDGGVGGVAF
jgi:hypothetical protein